MKALSAISRDTWMTLVFSALLGGFIFMETSGYPTPKAQGFGSGPAFYPRVLAAVSIFIGVFAFIRDFHSRRRSPAENPGAGGAVPASGYGQVAAFFTICVVAILVMAHLGFLLSGFLLIFFSTLMIRRALTLRGTAAAAVYAIGIMAVIYLIFSVFVGVQLPPSTLFKFR